MSKKKPTFDINAYKANIKDREVHYKKDSFINVDECLQDVLGLPGIPRGHVTQIYGKSDTGKCISKDSTYLITSKGIQTLGDALNDNVSHVENKEVGYWHDDGFRKGKKITFSDGSIIEGTPNHKIKVVNARCELEWKRLDELKVNTFVPNVISDLNFNNPFDNDLAELLGWIIADGHCSGKSITLSGLLNPKYEIVKSLMEKCGVYSECNSYLYINVEDTKKLGLDIHYLSATKVIPKIILKSNPKAICSFLRGLLSGDGSFNNNTLEWTTASTKLAAQTQFIFKALGIQCTIVDKYAALTDKYYKRLSITGGINSLKIFNELIGLSHPHKDETLKNYINNTKPHFKKFIPYAGQMIFNDYKKRSVQVSREERSSCGNLLVNKDQLTKDRWSKIQHLNFISDETFNAIETIKDYNFVTVAKIEDWEGEVADPNIPEDHTYHANNLITHNTSLLFHMASMAQANGELPIVYVTEGKVDWTRAVEMGFDKDGYALIEESYSTLEEIFDDILNKLAEQARGELPKHIVFFWDSIGNTISEDEFKDDKDGNREVKATMMKAAKVIKGYMRHVNPKITDTRKVETPHNASLVFINQAYVQPPTPPARIGTLKPYGGDGIWYAASLIIETKKRSKLEVTKNGIRMKFGTVSNVTIKKNHINGIERAGEYVITPNSIIPNTPSAIAKYKKDNKDSWGDLDLEEHYE